MTSSDSNLPDTHVDAAAGASGCLAGDAACEPVAGACADAAAAADAPAGDDSFELFDLKVEVVAGDKPFVCSHHVGDSFLVQGENLVFPAGASFSMYALAAILPMLPAKQRPLHPNDWMLSDAEIACPDPNCGARFRITRVARRTQSHAACTVVPLAGDAAE